MTEVALGENNFLIPRSDRGKSITIRTAAIASLKAVYNLEHEGRTKPIENSLVLAQFYEVLDMCRLEGIGLHQLGGAIADEMIAKKIPFPKAERKSGYETLRADQRIHSKAAKFLVAAFYEPEDRL